MADQFKPVTVKHRVTGQERLVSTQEGLVKAQFDGFRPADKKAAKAVDQATAAATEASGEGSTARSNRSGSNR